LSGYLNNEISLENTFSAGVPSNYINSIGQLTAGRSYFNGVMANIRIYNRALNENEIAALYYE
jgi:hypothetical protein